LTALLLMKTFPEINTG